LRIVVREEISEDPELRRVWNGLALRMDRPQVFYTYEWAIAVQRAYAASLTPLIFLAYEGESVVGVAALARKSSGQVVFLTADTGDYCEFLSDEGIRQEFVDAVFAALRDSNIEKIVLTNLPADSATTSAISRAAPKARYHMHFRSAYACAQVVMASAEERTLLKQSLLAKKRLRRNIRELNKRGPVTVQHDSNWNQIESLLPPFSRAHVARFLETGKISSLIREERRVFLAELARELSRFGWVALSRLLVGEVPAAWNYGFRFASSWFWYQPTVNSLYWDFSPGYCLLAKIVELACDSPELNLVDLGLGAEGYKERFATATRQTVYCELNRSILSHLHSVMRYRAASLATASPRVEKWIRSTISRAAELRTCLHEEGWGGLLTRLLRRVRQSVFFLETVLFFEWAAGENGHAELGTRLCPLNSEILGSAAIQYGDDPSALRFLMRSAQRLLSGQGMGFVLFTGEGIPVHFCWTKNFEGFQMAELDRDLHASCKDAVMIFDCFTPCAARGHGFFSDAITMLADQLRSQGKVPWTFGAAANQASVRGIQKTSFAYRFSLGRKRILFFSRTQDSAPAASAMEPASAA